MKKLLDKIGIAGRLTLLVAVLLAIFAAPWVAFGTEKIKNNIRTEAQLGVHSRIDSINNILTYKDYDMNAMPSADTPEFDRLRADLSVTMFAGIPYILRYLDAAGNPADLRSGLLMTCADEKGRDVQYDFSGFSEDDLRRLHEILLPLSSDDIKDTASAVAVPIDFYGKKTVTQTVTLFTLNRIAIDGTEWTAQTPVEESDETHAQVKTVSWPFDSDKALERYLNATRYLDYRLALENEASVSADELNAPSLSDFVFASGTLSYGAGTVYGAAPIDWPHEFRSELYLMPLVTVCLYALLLLRFYRHTRLVLSRGENS